MTQKLTTIGHSTAFNYEYNPYRIVSYKRPQNDKCKTIQTRKLTNTHQQQKIERLKHKMFESIETKGPKETTKNVHIEYHDFELSMAKIMNLSLVLMFLYFVTIRLG